MSFVDFVQLHDLRTKSKTSFYCICIQNSTRFTQMLIFNGTITPYGSQTEM